MSCRLSALAFDARDARRAAAFWSTLLQRHVVEDSRGLLVPGSDLQVGLRFVPTGSHRLGLNRAHVHLTSSSAADQQLTIASALGLGASHLDVGQLPDEGHVVLADPEGNEFCVIEPGNSFLADTGYLGELACDGTRQTGLFWAQALGWPLVWDQDEETAIQSPHGGTKVAWGGPPLAAKLGRNRVRFDLTVDGGDFGAEVERLLALGGDRDGRTAGWCAGAG